MGVLGPCALQAALGNRWSADSSFAQSMAALDRASAKVLQCFRAQLHDQGAPILRATDETLKRISRDHRTKAAALSPSSPAS